MKKFVLEARATSIREKRKHNVAALLLGRCHKRVAWFIFNIPVPSAQNRGLTKIVLICMEKRTMKRE